MRLFFVPGILLLLALSLAACGGSSGNDESEIEKAIEKSAASNDPTACTRLQTLQFTEQTTQEVGKAAVHGCEEEAKKEEGGASAAVSNVEVDGSTATAEAALKGGSFDGQTVEVELVKDGDQWKLNEVVKFTRFDKAKLVEAFERELSKAQNELSPKVVSCVAKVLEKDAQAKIEEFLLGNSIAALEVAIRPCVEA